MGDVDQAAAALQGAVAVFARMPDLAFVVDARQQLVGRNAVATARVETAQDPWSHVAESARDTLRAAVTACLHTGEARQFEWGELGASDVVAWYCTVVSPIEADGKLVGASVSCRDITGLKKSVERHRSREQLMVDAQGVAHLGVWEWDITQPHATWSDELYRIYGLTPETYTPSYEAYLTKVHPEDRQRVIDATNKVFHEHVPYSHDERIFRPDGSIRYLHTWAHPVLDAGGKLVSLVGVCQDITDRAEAELALQKLNAELEQRVADRTNRLETALHDLEMFNSIVSHDLRAPLTVVQLGIDVIAKDPASAEKFANPLGRMRRAIENMTTLMSNLLMFARVGEGAIAPSDVDATAMAHEILAEVLAASPERQITVEIEPDLHVYADRTLMRVVLGNLIGNAVKYTSKTAAPKIQIGRLPDRDAQTLFVRDNGIGFDMTEVDRLFVPFSRLSSAADHKGSGLGLATVQRIVQRHGGTIRAEGALGEGATFCVRLPPRSSP